MGARERRCWWGLWAPSLCLAPEFPVPTLRPATHPPIPCLGTGVSCQHSSSIFSSLGSVPDSLPPSCRCLRASPWTSSPPAPPRLLWAGCHSVPSWARPAFPPHTKFPGRPGLVAPRLPQAAGAGAQLIPALSPPPPARLQSGGPSVHLDFSPFIHPSPSHDATSPPIPHSHSHTPPPHLPLSTEKSVRPAEAPRSPQMRPSQGALQVPGIGDRGGCSGGAAPCPQPPPGTRCSIAMATRIALKEDGREREHERERRGAGLRESQVDSQEQIDADGARDPRRPSRQRRAAVGPLREECALGGVPGGGDIRCCGAQAAREGGTEHTGPRPAEGGGPAAPRGREGPSPACPWAASAGSGPEWTLCFLRPVRGSTAQDGSPGGSHQQPLACPGRPPGFAPP